MWSAGCPRSPTLRQEPGSHHSRARTHAPPAEATRPGPQGRALGSSALLARPYRPTAAPAASAVGADPSTPLGSGLIKKKQLRGTALPAVAAPLSRRQTRGWSGGGMRGSARSHCTGEGEKVEGAEEEQG